MKKNKKAVFYSIILLIFTIFILIVALIGAIKKTSHEKKIGEEQIELIKKYIEGEKVLFYIDQSAKYSIYNAIYSFAKQGIYFNEEAPCGSYKIEDGDEMYMLWENVIKNDETGENQNVPCYPTKKDIAINFGLFLNNKLDSYLEIYPNVKIPKDNYDFKYEEGKDSINITAIASQDIVFPFDRGDYRETITPTLSKEEQKCLSKNGYVQFFKKEEGKWVYSNCDNCPKDATCDRYINEVYCNLDPCNINCAWKDDKCESDTSIYRIKPSFKIKLPYNLITKFMEYSDRTKEIKDKIQQCLLKGSGKPDDDDLTTCSDVDKLKNEIKDINNYKIGPKTEDKGDKNYLLLFNIVDNSFKSIYYDKELTAKWGIRFMDTFPPPVTEITGIEQKEGSKYLVWKKNNASDVIKYKIYARALKPVQIDENDLVKEIDIDDKSATEWKIEYKSSEECSKKEGEGTCLEEGKEYYFYILAIDNAHNVAKDIGIWPKDAEQTLV